MNNVIKICAVLTLLLFAWGVYAKGNPSGSGDYKTDAPSDNLRIMVTEAWLLMYPENGGKPDYKKAYQMNEEAYKKGHSEGASNIGLMYERGLGVKKDEATALKWYSSAMSSPYHSPQAEIGTARIILNNLPNQENLELATKYLDAARSNALNPISLWYEERENFLKEIAILQNELDYQNSKNQ